MKRRTSTARKSNQTIRIVVEQVPASPVSRAGVGLVNTLLKKANPSPQRAKY